MKNPAPVVIDARLHHLCAFMRICAHLCNLRMTLFYPQMTQATQIPALPGNAGFYNPRRMK
ncbi:hypothetical protein [Verminephrobacter eiseniae]|uniref:hypothetical protein n=1 Tax=Verminephrobacter eiseniae TaxID=364317 RepID=UPI002238A2FB|nr:hypothetical protein [Verminephrobacter eiseniae]